jgi:hypothetical protein
VDPRSNDPDPVFELVELSKQALKIVEPDPESNPVFIKN